ncbi:hypothetical protein ANN_20791 [Periplaneta americana]|uniref:HTH psq-type domain-containing protein n=1 Tax=Periplaneta americana TaxID=6978 RepID=A0ABQ8SDR1_PERAM|nr:hypothetical protein ANN_20791 [Periplaneta americana]
MIGIVAAVVLSVAVLLQVIVIIVFSYFIANLVSRCNSSNSSLWLIVSDLSRSYLFRQTNYQFSHVGDCLLFDTARYGTVTSGQRVTSTTTLLYHIFLFSYWNHTKSSYLIIERRHLTTSEILRAIEMIEGGQSRAHFARMLNTLWSVINRIWLRYQVTEINLAGLATSDAANNGTL